MQPIEIVQKGRDAHHVTIRRRLSSFLSDTSSPVTSDSYASHLISPAVSFLASVADRTSSETGAPGVYFEGDQINQYLLKREIGHGAFSRVFEADIMDDTLSSVAIKIVKKDVENRCQVYHENLVNEIKVWSKISHPYIIQLIDVLEVNDALFVVSELAHCSLLDYLRECGPLPESTALRLFSHLVKAVDYLHGRGIVHRDIKCENILLVCYDSQGTFNIDHASAKLCDFGLCYMAKEHSNEDGKSTTEPVAVGSLHYCSPEEVTLSRAISFSGDVWSLGCVLYAMLTCKLPFDDEFLPRLQLQICKGQYDCGRLDRHQVSPETKDCIKRMLEVNMDRRITIDELRSLPILQDSEF